MDDMLVYFCNSNHACSSLFVCSFKCCSCWKYIILFPCQLDCGVYSNGCEQFISSPWSSITEYKVSCSFSGYVKKIVKTVEYYSNSKCDDSSFIKNEYSFSFTNSNGNKGIS